jgi:hypothetical protein
LVELAGCGKWRVVEKKVRGLDVDVAEPQATKSAVSSAIL